MHSVLLALHIAAGSVSILAMVVPLIAHKGGSVHRRSGWVYVVGTALVCVTALVMSAARFVTDGTQEGQEFSLLLAYVAVLTGAGMWAGIRVLRSKDRVTRGSGADVAMAALLASSGLGTAIYGWLTGHPLILAFSVIGLLNGSGQLQYWLRPPTVPMHWWFAHMGNMLGACIATITAFILFVGRHTGSSGDSLILWLAPTAIGLPAIAVWMEYYRRKFFGSRRRPIGALAEMP
jgi:hypothetical protein